MTALWQLFFSKVYLNSDHINPSRPEPGRGEKIHFHTSLWCLKGFMKGSKAFIKPFEAPQGSRKIKIYVNIYFNTTF